MPTPLALYRLQMSAPELLGFGVPGLQQTAVQN
jgi:hypothetical protein